MNYLGIKEARKELSELNSIIGKFHSSNKKKRKKMFEDRR